MDLRARSLYSCNFHTIWILLFQLFFFPEPVTSLIDQICVNVGYENVKDGNTITLYTLVGGSYQHFPGAVENNVCRALFNVVVGQHFAAHESTPSIGGKKFRSESMGAATLSFNKETLGLLPLPLGASVPDCCEIHDTSLADISTFAVKHNNKYLNGWMGIQVFIKEEAIWAFIQVSDERGNAIGELVTTSGHTCPQPASAPMTANPMTEQFLPCTATGLQEAKSSQGFVYTKKDFIAVSVGKPTVIDQYMGSPLDPTQGLKMRLTWRLNEYYCNRHARFRVVLYFLTKKGSENSYRPFTNFQRGDWYLPKWFGVADVIPKSSSPDCSDVIDKQFIDKNKDFWIKTIQPFVPNTEDPTLKPENEGPNFPNTLYKSCRTYITRLYDFHGDVKRQPSYGGRCEKIDEKKFKPQYYKSTPHSKSSVDVPHQCLKNTEADYPPEMEDYKGYVEKKIETRKSLCSDKSQKCPELKGLTSKTIKKAFVGDYLSNATGRYIMKSRAYHGTMFTWTALFFIPISNFMARFFKETFLADDILGMRVWYFVHIASTFMVINFSVSGLVANGKVTALWGRSWSQAGVNHRILGWSCCVLYVIVAVIGPFRPERHRLRLIFMVLHSALGYIQYFMGLFALMTSALIPGSPSATTCYKKIPSFDPFYSPGFGDMYDHQIATVVTWWICLDFLFYGLMSFMQWRADRSWEIQRRHYFPLVPIVNHGDRKSFKCFRYRTLVLLIYIFILAILAIVTTQRLYESDWRGCDIGTMTCTHINVRGESAYQESQCGRLAQIQKERKALAIESRKAKQKKRRP